MALVAPSLGSTKQQEGETMEDSSWHIGITPPSSNDGGDSDYSDDSSSSNREECNVTSCHDDMSMSIEDDDTKIQSPSTPNPRKSRTRTVEVHSPMKHVASSEKVRCAFTIKASRTG